MFFLTRHWNLEDDPRGNVAHILRRHGITKDEFAAVLVRARRLGVSSRSGPWTDLGALPDGRLLRIVLEQVAPDEYYPITAFEPGPKV